MSNASYETASQYFLLRNFSEALESLADPGSTSSPKPYLLYLALCDRAFVEPDSKEWPLNDPGRKELRRLVLKSTMWSKFEKQWESFDEVVPSAIIITGFKLAAKFGADPKPIVDFVESYMARHTLPENVFLVFVQDILVGLQHDFFYARELAKNRIYTDQTSQKTILDLIDQEELDYNHEMSEELERVSRMEWERVEEAKLLAKKEAPEQLESSADEGLVVRDVKSVRRAREPRLTLTQMWRKWFHDFMRGQGLFNALIFVFFLMAVVSNARMRNSLYRAGQRVWASIKTSLRMATTVSYL